MFSYYFLLGFNNLIQVVIEGALVATSSRTQSTPTVIYIVYYGA